MKSSLIRKIVIATFLSVPAISSVISTIHLIDLFNLGNPTWLSILLAVTFELGSIASLLAISVIEKIKVGAIWFIFFILSGLQIIGNVYYSYSFTSDQLLSNPVFLTNFMDLFSFITGEEIKDVKIFLSCIIGIPIPLIALFFLKSNIDYLRPDKEKAIDSLIETNIDPTPVDSPVETNIDHVQVNDEPIVEPEHESPMVDKQESNVHKPLNALATLTQDLGMYEEPIEPEESNPSPDPIPTPTIQSEQPVDNQDHDVLSQNRRNPRPMISERRSDSVSVLHRG